MFSFNNITFNTTIEPIVNETFGPMVNETNGTFMNKNSGARNEEEMHESGGFPYPLLALIIPIGLLILFAIYICTCECISNYRRRQWMTQDSGSSLHSSFYEGGISFTPRPKIFFIKGMKQFIVEEPEKIKDCCSICIEDYKVNDKMVRLPCGHEFHKDCIHPWLRQQVEEYSVPYCPICKKEQVVEYREEVTEMDLEDGLMIEKV